VAASIRIRGDKELLAWLHRIAARLKRQPYLTTAQVASIGWRLIRRVSPRARDRYIWAGGRPRRRKGGTLQKSWRLRRIARDFYRVWTNVPYAGIAHHGRRREVEIKPKPPTRWLVFWYKGAWRWRKKVKLAPYKKPSRYLDKFRKLIREILRRHARRVVVEIVRR